MTKTMTAAVALALAIGTGSACAQGVGPAAPITPFTIWSMEGGNGKSFTPMPELMRKAHEGEALNNAPAPRGFAQQPPALGAPAKN
jgi:hypothetical protein